VRALENAPQFLAAFFGEAAVCVAPAGRLILGDSVAKKIDFQGSLGSCRVFYRNCRNVGITHQLVERRDILGQ